MLYLIHLISGFTTAERTDRPMHTHTHTKTPKPNQSKQTKKQNKQTKKKKKKKRKKERNKIHSGGRKTDSNMLLNTIFGEREHVLFVS